MPKHGQPEYPTPNQRRLRIFSFDPAADISLETAGISRCEVRIPWEEVKPGPVGEYIEVVDLDPSSDCIYHPVDLMDFNLLATDGLEPSTGNPQFHQQMVYAVAMKTIHNFEQVLGRHIQWSERIIDEKGIYITAPDQRYVGRLRIYPHALREQNAFYSPLKKALLFGYFNAATSDPRDELPGGVVFTCLSHDIIAHETTHAIIDGLHRRLLDATNHDMLAFHEAFADIVAIFQHFTLPGVLLDQIQRTRGDLRVDNLLVKLASQFARATGQGGALRNALGERRPGGRMEPDPEKLGHTIRPHERGAILVAAVFEAFLRIYENRIKDLRRIATGGTGVLPKGDIHPDLTGRLSAEATNASQHVLNICIRALDYLPPVDVTFGDFLRSLITADADFYPNDMRHYRLAFVEAFRERGIYPNDVRTLSEDSLRWSPIDGEEREQLKDFLPPPEVLRTMAYAYGCENRLVPRLDKFNKELRRSRRKSPDVMAKQFLQQCWIPAADDDGVPCDNGMRYNRYRLEREFATFLHRWIMVYAEKIRSSSNTAAEAEAWFSKVGYNFGLDLKQALRWKDDTNLSRLEVHAVRPTIRMRPDGISKVELLILLTQSNHRNLPGSDVVKAKNGKDKNPLRYKFRGGCTLLIDPEQGTVRYAIGKSLLSKRRRSGQEAFLHDRLNLMGADAIDRFGLRFKKSKTDLKKERNNVEPFALAHRHEEIGDEYNE